MKYTAIFFATITILSSCRDKGRIDYAQSIDTTSVDHDDRLTDSTKVVVAELPIRFDSTAYLLFGISLVELQDRGGYSKVSLSSYDDYSSSGSYLHEDEFTGSFINMLFEDASGNQRKLTSSKIMIRSATFVREIFRRTKSGYILYSVSDRDSNHDNSLTHADLEALYISRIDGSNFHKLSRELHEFYDWTAIKGDNKIYFRTLEDRNKDGELNNKDIFHYYRMDFSGESYGLTEYYPVKAFAVGAQ
jgi:hypothetical protein